MYDYGFGVAKDEVEAARWILMAAEQGFDKAQYNMGKRFRDGVGVDQNAATAAKWFKVAADQGHARAQHHLGVRYLNGNGVEKDPVAALMWLTLSARAGDRTAAKERDKLITQLPSDQISKAESMADKWRPKGKRANG